MYYDAHTHLNDDALYPEREKYLSDFIALGGKGLVCIGVDHVWNERAITIAKQSSVQFSDCIVKAAVGLHPSEICYGHLADEAAIDAAIAVLEQQLNDHANVIVAVGECGMDAHYADFDQHKSLQQYLFTQQCMLARRHQLPIVIHSRDAFDETMAVLKDYSDLRVYMHCRSYTPQQLEKMIACFPRLWIGFCGNVTYPKAEGLRASLLTLVHSPGYQSGCVQLLLETDAPWLSPQTKRGQQNVPTNVVDIYTAISGYLGGDLIVLQKAVMQSWQTLYIVERH